MILWIVGGLIALIVIAMLLVQYSSTSRLCSTWPRNKLKQIPGGPDRRGGAELSFFPRFGLRLEGTSLDLPAQSEYDPTIKASVDELDVGLSLLPLLGGNVDVGTIVIAGVTADITDAAALPPLPEPAPVMSDREWEQRGEMIRRTKEKERQRQLEEASGIKGIAILAEAVRIEDIVVMQRTSDGELSNTIQIASLTLSDVNTSNEPMRLEGKLSVLGDGTVTPLDITLDGAIKVASDFSSVLIDGLDTEVLGALSEPVTSALDGEFVMSPAAADMTLAATLPGGEVTGTLNWSALESPEIKLYISTDRLDVDQIQPAAQPQESTASDVPAPATAEPALQSGGGAPVPLPVGPLRDLDPGLQILPNSSRQVSRSHQRRCSSVFETALRISTTSTGSA